MKPHWPATIRKETDIEADVVRYLGAMGFWTLRTHVKMGPHGSNRPSRAGVLDIMFGKGALWGGIEVKTDSGLVQGAQLEEMMRIDKAGGISFVARSVFDVEDALRSRNADKG